MAINPLLHTVIASILRNVYAYIAGDQKPKKVHYVTLSDSTIVSLREFAPESKISHKTPVVLINHTLAGNWRDEIATKDTLVQLGYIVLLYSRRGHDETLNNTGAKFHTNGIPSDLEDVVQ